MNHRIIGVIPARYGSTRLEGKPLKSIAGKPLLQWVIEGALESKKLAEIRVATDDQRILELAESLGVKAVMTDADLPSGSDRVWAATKDDIFDAVINIQGDEPLLTGPVLDSLAEAFEPGIDMATLGRPMKSEEELQNPTVAKIVANQNGEALYFSRLPIPHSRVQASALGGFACLKHIGFYLYSKSFLGRFCAQKPVALEQAEGLEQLRALWLGAKIKVVQTNTDSWGVDTPEDVIRVEKILSGRTFRGRG